MTIKKKLTLKTPTPKVKPTVETHIQGAIFIEQTLKRLPIHESEKDYTRINEILTKQGKKALEIVGITLTTPQQKAVNVALLLLNQRSQRVNRKKDDYYTGDAGNVTPDAYGRRYAELTFTLYEATKMFYGRRNINARDMDFVKSIYDELTNEVYAMEYKVQTINQQGQKVNHDIKETASLLTSIKSTNQSTRIVTLSYQLNKIFTANIGQKGKYITKPNDNIQRIEQGYNSNKPHELAHNLNNYLLQILSAGQTLNTEIYWSNLLPKIAPNHRKDENGKNIREDKLKANVIRALKGEIKNGLVKEFKEVDGATGEKKLQIELIKDWIK